MYINEALFHSLHSFLRQMPLGSDVHTRLVPTQGTLDVGTQKAVWYASRQDTNATMMPIPSCIYNTATVKTKPPGSPRVKRTSCLTI